MEANIIVGNNTIYHNLTIKSNVEKVFEAISNPEHLINWWPEKCSGEKKIGGEYNFYFGPEYDWFGKVINYNPNNNFHIKMTKSDLDWQPTSFGFDLTEVNDNVLLRFWHSGWLKQNDHFKISSYCWAILLKGLKDYIEKGEIIPFEQRS